MAKKKLIVGTLIGVAVIGIAIIGDDETRDFVKKQAKKARDGAGYYVQNPSEAIHNVKERVQQLGDTFTNTTNKAIQTIETVEDTVEGFIGSKE